MSQLEVDKIIPQSGTTLTIGDSGDTVTFADGTNIGIDTNTLYIDSTNNRVGIGTTSPSYKLSILEGGNNFLQFSQGGDASAGSLIGRSNSTNLRIQNSENASTEFWTNNTERMRITSAGLVGIGTSSPSKRLHVEGAGSTYALIKSTNAGSGTGLYFQNATSNYLIGAGSVSGGSELVFYDVTNSTERMRINSNGNVGIGTTLPSQALDVVGSIEVSDGVYLGGTGTANKLDDYEEGTWTPVFEGATTAGSYTYTTQVGTYTKIGRLVTVNCELLNVTQSSAGSGHVKITGLPFTASSTNTSWGSVSLDRFTFTGYEYVIANIGTDKNFVYFFKIRQSDTDSLLQVSDRNQDGSDLKFTISYEV